MLDYLIPIAVILFLIFVNGFFVAAEFAVAAASRPRIAQLAESGSSAARRVLHVLSDPAHINRYLSTAQIGITLASLALGMYGEHTVAEWFIGPLEHLGWFGVATAHTIATVIAVAFLTYLHVVLGEMIPKSLALQSASTVAVYLSSSMALTEQLFRPLTSIFNWIGNALLRLFGIPIANPEARLVSSDELAYILEESSESGLLDPTEQIFLENVIDFQQRSVGQVMTPRTRMAAIPVDADRQEVLSLVCDDRHSRYPVYEDDRDHIVGILYIKDLARQLLEPPTTFELRTLLRPAVFVPETLALDEMLAQFRSAHFQIAVVLDEYGGTAGIVTLEDLAEEIIGEIQDEFDEEIAPFEELDATTLRVRGDLLLDELTQHYDLDFEAEEAETVGGLIMSMLGHVAQPGEHCDYQGLRLEVESMDGLAVNTAIVTLPNSVAVPAVDDAESSAQNEPPQPK
jgi:CBS domain containing-hemolysin-like protein